MAEKNKQEQPEQPQRQHEAQGEPQSPTLQPEGVVQIPKELFEKLRKSIDPEHRINEPALAAEINELAKAALKEWADWFDGSFRPNSIAELETQRIFAIYDRIWTEDLPSAEHLGQWLGLPMGRARYIIQSLEYHKGQFLKERQRHKIVEALENGQESTNEKNEITNIKVTIDRSCRSLMDQTIRKLIKNKKIPSEVSGHPKPDGVVYDFGSVHKTALLHELESRKRE